MVPLLQYEVLTPFALIFMSSDLFYCHSWSPLESASMAGGGQSNFSGHGGNDSVRRYSLSRSMLNVERSALN
jgi:hypothetical protein